MASSERLPRVYICDDCDFVDYTGEFDKCACGGDSWRKVSKTGARLILEMAKDMKAAARTYMVVDDG